MSMHETLELNAEGQRYMKPIFRQRFSTYILLPKLKLRTCMQYNGNMPPFEDFLSLKG
jgi:hypothetical protein